MLTPAHFALRATAVCSLLFSAVALLAAEAPNFSGPGVAFLKKYCVDCHSGEKPEADLSLTVFGSNDSLIPARKKWDAALRMLNGGLMPPPNEEQPTADERSQFVALVKSVFEEYDRTAPPNAGRVTMRRLNRREYNRTIQDLVGVDFDPAEDFPSDDIGYGFDNIGDVLTLPPILMERYLAAAETIMQRAILPKPPAPPKRAISARYTEPASGEVSQARFRPISNRPSEKAIETGPLFTRYQIPNGEYVFRTKVYAESEDGKPVRMAVLACSPEPGDRAATDETAEKLFGLAVNGLRPFVIVETIEITATSADNAQNIEVKLPVIPGLDRTAVALFKPADGEPPETLHVEFLALEGPLDTRPESHRRIMACSPDKPHDEQTREVLERFTARAWRRPVTSDELDRLSRLVALVEAEGGQWEEGIQFALQAVLVSPGFLFRIELDDGQGTDDKRPLGEFQLASRLSYFIWSTMPDDELFELARAGKLRENLEPQVRRMLASPKSSALIDNFAMQWLQLQRLESYMPDAGRFPTFDVRLRRSMIQETRLLFEEIIREDRSVLDLIKSDYTYLNETLARHYGIRDTNGNPASGPPTRPSGQPIPRREFVRVSLGESPLGGLLTHASVLTVTSNPTRTSPVKRGKWVLEQLLGTPPPPPPPNVPELEAAGRQLTGTLRERMEQHRSNPSCASCHTQMDALGFAFENFDAIGKWREKDGEGPIDPSGKLPTGEAFSGPAELKEILLTRRDEFTSCLVEKMLTYALGRGLDDPDRPAINQIVKNVGTQDYRFSALVSEIVKSTPFGWRGRKQSPGTEMGAGRGL